MEWQRIFKPVHLTEDEDTECIKNNKENERMTYSGPETRTESSKKKKKK